MIRVRVVKGWNFPDLKRQTPGGDGIWGDILLTEEPLPECEYLLLLGVPTKDIEVRCPPENVWLICQEPPTENFLALHGGTRQCARIYTQDVSRKASRFIHSQPALPWFVNRDYTYLRDCSPPEKTRDLSWVTSNKGFLRGHQKRIQFLNRIRNTVEFDLFGRGFQEVEDKWDGLAPYRYTIAVENFAGPYYFTEKIMDAYLSWTMPIYCGCTNIDSFFPKESYVALDINSPDAPAMLREIVKSDLAERHKDAIAEARRIILDELQLFPFLSAQIKADLTRSGCCYDRRQALRIRGTRLFARRLYNKVLKLAHLN